MKFKLKPFQQNFIYSKKRFPAFVAAWGTGKTMSAIFRGIGLTEKYPNNLGMIVRKEFTTLQDSTLKDYEKYSQRKVVGVQKPTDKFSNGSLVMFRHASEISPTTLQNINLGWFFIEQAEELENDRVFQLLRGRLRRDNIPLRTGFVTANVNGHNWVYDLWKKEKGLNPKFPLEEATSFDNADNLPKDTIEDWREMEKTSPSIYQQYVMNNWDEAVDGRWVIPVNLVENAQKHTLTFKELKRLVVCDPSLGNDETVIQCLENTRIIAEKVLPEGFRDTMKIAGELVVFKQQHKATTIVVDCIGIGRGISDRLTEMGHQVIDINSSEKAKDPQFVNVRAEMWWQAGRKFMDNQIDLGDIRLFDYNTLKKQLSSVLYIVVDSSGKIQIEKKEDIVKRLGCSPDHADCYIMGLYGLQFAPVLHERVKDYKWDNAPTSKSFMSA